QTLQWVEEPKLSKIPLPQGLTVYTDAGRKSKTAAITWQEYSQWSHKIIQGLPEDSLQTLELTAVIWALNEFQRPVNVITDSLYVVGIVQRIEESLVKVVQNKRLYILL
ncbi:PO113 protein, partial [Tachuris rubrigastra]|nr:PO113 protein [Tachuris rubrigastra]